MYLDIGMPTADRKWSLNNKVQEYCNEKEDGTFKIRVCKECFSTFEAASICPYCGAVYELDPIEIKNIKEIELKKIEDEKEAKRLQYKDKIQEKVKGYCDASECKNWYELVQFCIVNGYKPGYAFHLNQKYRLNYKPYGGK